MNVRGDMGLQPTNMKTFPRFLHCPYVTIVLEQLLYLGAKNGSPHTRSLKLGFANNKKSLRDETQAAGTTFCEPALVRPGSFAVVAPLELICLRDGYRLA